MPVGGGQERRRAGGVGGVGQPCPHCLADGPLHAAPSRWCPDAASCAFLHPSPPRAAGHAPGLRRGVQHAGEAAPGGAAAARAARPAGGAPQVHAGAAAEVGRVWAGLLLRGKGQRGELSVHCCAARARSAPSCSCLDHCIHLRVPSRCALGSEEDEDACHRRVQRLRAFLHGARQFVAALQAFLHARTAGKAWGGGAALNLPAQHVLPRAAPPPPLVCLLVLPRFLCSSSGDPWACLSACQARGYHLREPCPGLCSARTPTFTPR